MKLRRCPIESSERCSRAAFDEFVTAENSRYRRFSSARCIPSKLHRTPNSLLVNYPVLAECSPAHSPTCRSPMYWCGTARRFGKSGTKVTGILSIKSNLHCSDSGSSFPAWHHSTNRRIDLSPTNRSGTPRRSVRSQCIGVLCRQYGQRFRC